MTTTKVSIDELLEDLTTAHETKATKLQRLAEHLLHIGKIRRKTEKRIAWLKAQDPADTAYFVEVPNGKYENRLDWSIEFSPPEHEQIIAAEQARIDAEINKFRAQDQAMCRHYQDTLAAIVKLGGAA